MYVITTFPQNTGNYIYQRLLLLLNNILLHATNKAIMVTSHESVSKGSLRESGMFLTFREKTHLCESPTEGSCIHLRHIQIS